MSYLRYERSKTHDVWHVYNKRETVDIACISWYPRWRKYVVSFRENCPFDSKCLQEIITFIEEIKNDNRNQ